MDRQAPSNLHALIFPFPEQGHIDPLLHMAVELASKGLIVTFLNTERNHERMIHSHPAAAGLPHGQFEGLIDLRFVTIPDGLSLPSSSPLPGKNPLLQSLQRQGPVLKKLIEGLERTGPRVSCLISDGLLPWAGEVARDIQIPSVVFWAASATRLCVNFFISNNGLETSASEPSRTAVSIPGLPLSSAQIATVNRVQEPGRLQLLRDRSEAMENASCVLVNTFDEIEGEALAAIPLNTPIWSIGPLHLGAASRFDRIQGSLRKPDEDCLPWLDTQQADSVLYVAFGSMVSVPAAQLAELAQGVEASEKPFLWVHRDLEQLPEDFKERTKGVGRVVKWAPQRMVLRHRSVGAFLTHCGWNSVMEATASGVAMVCWPVMADQPNNRVLVEEQWRVGRGLWASSRSGSGELVEASQVSSVVKSVMEDEELKHRAGLLSHSSKLAVLQGGSSHNHLQAFLHHLHTSSPHPLPQHHEACKDALKPM